ncbi:MAG: guanylate kinase, partial [Betaproteobacteria bacterium]|nr:guanylate kinase [Betaproteobacteria bacterium]
RGKDSPEVIEKRLAAVHEDQEHAPEADYVIINSEFDTAVSDLQAIVRAVRLTAKRQLSLHAALFSPVRAAHQ